MSERGLILKYLDTYQFLQCVRESVDHVSRTYVKRASHASSTLIPSELQVQADVSRAGRVTPIPSHVINMTLPGNSESYYDRLRERLNSPPETPPRHRG